LFFQVLYTRTDMKVSEKQPISVVFSGSLYSDGYESFGKTTDIGCFFSGCLYSSGYGSFAKTTDIGCFFQALSEKAKSLPKTFHDFATPCIHNL
jgi:hypothetical protein